MTRFILLAAAALFATILTSNIFAQNGTRSIKGGVLNGKAISLPKPEYPEEAKAARLEGTVQVRVLIDENGDVISAEAANEAAATVKMRSDNATVVTEAEPVSPLLADAARTAALSAKFSPTRLSGSPVRVSGVIIYRFVMGDGVASAAPAEELKPAIDGGLLNGKAASLPMPAYPAAARAVRAEGSVSVRVVVDEMGDVISVAVLSGHPLLRSAAMEAARRAKFEPTLLSGKAVRFSGILTYNFVP